MPDTDKLEHEIIRAEIRAILIQSESNSEVMNNILKTLMEQVKIQNERIESLETITLVMKTLFKHPWLTILAFVGIFKVLSLINIEKWITSILY